MRYEDWSAIGHANGWLGARLDDPETSRQAVKDLTVRAGTQRHRLLEAYFQLHGATDEEAGKWAGLTENKCCYWKRCSELRQAGYITPTGETRASTAGVEQQVCYITPLGADRFNELLF